MPKHLVNFVERNRNEHTHFPMSASIVGSGAGPDCTVGSGALHVSFALRRRLACVPGPCDDSSSGRADSPDHGRRIGLKLERSVRKFLYPLTKPQHRRGAHRRARRRSVIAGIQPQQAPFRTAAARFHRRGGAEGWHDLPVSGDAEASGDQGLTDERSALLRCQLRARASTGTAACSLGRHRTRRSFAERPAPRTSSIPMPCAGLPRRCRMCASS